MTSESEKPGIFANRGMVVLAVVAGIALLATCILGVMLLRTLGDDTPVGAGTPTPFASNPEGVLDNEALVVGIDGNSTISVTVDVPVTLAVGDQMFSARQTHLLRLEPGEKC